MEVIIQTAILCVLHCLEHYEPVITCHYVKSYAWNELSKEHQEGGMGGDCY